MYCALFCTAFQWDCSAQKWADRDIVESKIVAVGKQGRALYHDDAGADDGDGDDDDAVGDGAVGDVMLMIGNDDAWCYVDDVMLMMLCWWCYVDDW